jgi:EpsI family protein
MLTRIYRSTSEGDGSEIMAMMAWGPTQTNDLQVHRPEVCFPAFGFALSEDRAVAVNIAGARVPSREFIATSGTSVGYVLYWTRLGEFLPQDRQAQKLARMQTALQGAVADGILVRFETAGPAKAAAFARLEAFASALVAAMNPVDRAVLIGTRLAAATGAAQA